MNNFKWQYLVCECKMDFPITTRIPSFENRFWIYLPDSIITVNVKHRQPTGDLQLVMLYTTSWVYIRILENQTAASASIVVTALTELAV